MHSPSPPLHATLHTLYPVTLRGNPTPSSTTALRNPTWLPKVFLLDHLASLFLTTLPRPVWYPRLALRDHPTYPFASPSPRPASPPSLALQHLPMSPYASTQRHPASLRNVALHDHDTPPCTIMMRHSARPRNAALRDSCITPYTVPIPNRPSSQSCFLSLTHSLLQTTPLPLLFFSRLTNFPPKSLESVKIVVYLQRRMQLFGVCV